MAHTSAYTGRTVWVRLIDIPLTTRRRYAELLRTHLLDRTPPDPAALMAALEKAADLQRAAEDPDPGVGLWVTQEKADSVLRGRRNGSSG